MSLTPHPDLTLRRFDSAILGNARDIWIQPTPSAPQGVLVLLDGEHYVRDLDVPAVVDELRAEGALAGLLPVYVSHVDYPTRWRESFCNPDFGAFLATELIPWLVDELEVGGALPNAVVGLSLTGLAATHAGLHHPGVVHRVVCQSASFWWNDGRLIDEVATVPASELTLWLSVGLREIDEDVDHGDGLIQAESQLSANRRMRDALLDRGFAVRYREHDGGHDRASFCADLPHALRALSPAV